MLKQLSAGVVVYRIGEDNVRTYLLLQYPGKYWDFPKGKLEANEKWSEAALREVEEETGLKVILEKEFEHSYMYTFNDFRGNKVEKTVLFFIGTVISQSDVTLSYEHIDYLWLTFEQARIQIHFETVRELLTQVEVFLNQKYNNNALLKEYA
jgi:8-oxo-dGTP pyrophosphatase MutT (NUDIX family)